MITFLMYASPYFCPRANSFIDLFVTVIPWLDCKIIIVEILFHVFLEVWPLALYFCKHGDPNFNSTSLYLSNVTIWFGIVLQVICGTHG